MLLSEGTGWVGLAVGSKVGKVEGLPVGSGVVGEVVGEDVGSEVVGDIEGDTVGSEVVGDTDGDFDGDSVGELAGEHVTPQHTAAQMTW